MNGYNLVAERSRTHGDFAETAALSDALLGELMARGHWRRLGVRHREALKMIAVKMARIACGDPDHQDHWDDIAGYAALGSGAPRRRPGNAAMKPWTKKRLATLQAGLAFASRAHRPAIQAQIDQLLAGEQDPERAEVVDPEAKPPEARVGAAEGAGNSSETEALPSAPAGARPGGPVCQETRAKPDAPAERMEAPWSEIIKRAARDVAAGESWAFTEHRSLAEVASDPPPRRGRYDIPPRACTICGTLYKPTIARQLACVTLACQRERRLAYSRDYQKNGKRKPPHIVPIHPQRPPDSARQIPEPLRCGLAIDPAVVIRPPRPAPVKRYSNGVPTPFQDDLNAIADHGSPGKVPAPPIAQARQSVLA